MTLSISKSVEKFKVSTFHSNWLLPIQNFFDSMVTFDAEKSSQRKAAIDMMNVWWKKILSTFMIHTMKRIHVGIRISTLHPHFLVALPHIQPLLILLFPKKNDHLGVRYEEVKLRNPLILLFPVKSIRLDLQAHYCKEQKKRQE